MAKKLSEGERKARIALWREMGCNTAATARAEGISRTSMQDFLHCAKDAGLIEESEMGDTNVALSQEYKSVMARKRETFLSKKRKGDWRKPALIRIPEGPFRLKIFGDPHLDADGCDVDLFEKHWLDLSVENRVFGVCVGDWFNNWLKVLGHLWKEDISRPDDAWTIFEYLIEQRGDALLAACSGNHDDWTNAPTDPIDLVLKRAGVVYRRGAIRVQLQAGEAPPITAAIRHKWKGNSMYSAAHWGVRANREGWRDNLLIGGHIHQDEPRLVSHPDGFKSHVCQVSSFKQFDLYADVHGFNGPRISPAWDLVIDPRRDDTDPDKIKIFWCSDLAAKHLEAIT